MMLLRMKVDAVLRINNKTIFTGNLESSASNIVDTLCIIEIDGSPAGEIMIGGEVLTGKPHRDLWAATPVDLSQETVRDHDVWLIAKPAL